MGDPARSIDPGLFRRLEERLLDPAVRSSEADLASLIAPDFVEFGGSGRVYDRDRVIAALQSEPWADRSLSDFTAREIAPGAVLVTYRVSRRDPAAGTTIGSLRSSIWIWRDGNWQVVFHQGTPSTGMGDPHPTPT